jgi:hypothetical protein
MTDGANIPPTEKPLCVLESLGSDAPILFAPRSYQELSDWLQTEREFWNWLRVHSFNEQAFIATRERQFHADADINNYLARAQNNPPDAEVMMNKTAARLRSRYNEERALHSSSPQAKFVAEIAIRDPRLAANVAMLLSGHPLGNVDNSAIIAGGLAANFLFGKPSSVEPIAKSWNELHSRITIEQENLRKSAGAAADDWRAQRDQISALHNQQRESFDVLQARRESEFKVSMDAHSAKVDQIRDALKKDMSLKAAVTYFKEKASSHSKKVGWFTALALAAAGGVVWGAFEVAASVFKEEAQPSPVQIGLTLICGFLALWLLRLLVRLLLSNLHIATDLRNRATLVQTYLALLADGGGGLTDKDRALIVGIVFRPVSDGLVRDDGVPPTLLTALQDVASGGRR